MGKEVVDMSTDEESDCVVICPPNGNADHEEVVSGSHDLRFFRKAREPLCYELTYGQQRPGRCV